MKGVTVYLIPAAFSDQANQLLSANGDYICSPGGSIETARGERKCAEAYTAPKGMQLVWRDPRLGITHKREDTTR